MTVTCHLCGEAAVAVFRFSLGCYCSSATTQPLCLQHAHKSGPVAGGTMELLEDLTLEGEFTRHWTGGRP